MKTKNDGYPEYLIRVSHSTMTILVVSESEDDKDFVVLKNKWGREEAYVPYPAKWEICGGCNGNGHYVNPSIDGNGLSDEMQSDPDFMEDYYAGSYDVTCESCCGSGKIFVPATEEGERAVNAMLRAAAYSRAEQAAERRMGC